MMNESWKIAHVVDCEPKLVSVERDRLKVYASSEIGMNITAVSIFEILRVETLANPFYGMPRETNFILFSVEDDLWFGWIVVHTPTLSALRTNRSES